MRLLMPSATIQEPLLRVLREGDVPHRARRLGVLGDEHFLDEGAVGLEHLQPIVEPVADVDQAVVGDVGAVHRVAEVRERRRVGVVEPELDAVVGRLAVGAPEPLHLAGGGVEHGDAAVEVAVGDVGLVGLGLDEDLGDPAEALLIAAPGREGRLPLLVLAGHPRVGLAVLGDELAVLGELHDVRVARAVAADPHHAGVVDEDAVVRVGPVVALPGATPALDQVAGLVEGEHAGRAGAAVAGLQLERLLVGGQGVGAAVDDPDVVAGVDPHADGVAEHPVVRQRLGPERVDLVARRLRRALDAGGGHVVERRLGDAQGDDGSERGSERPQTTVPGHERLPVQNESRDDEWGAGILPDNAARTGAPAAGFG